MPSFSTWRSAIGRGAALWVMLAGPACAQAPNVAPGAQPVVYPLYPASSFQPAKDALPETFEGGRIRNVSIPTLTVFRPKTGVDAHVAIIIAPGGGFVRLAIDSEGNTAARRLAEVGVTSFVLKYRLGQTVPRPAAATSAPASAPPPIPTRSELEERNNSPTALAAMADGLAAVAFVRAHAPEFGIAPNRIGFLGFSAGAAVTMRTATSVDSATRPDFAAAIYGVLPKAAIVPKPAPPLFLAVAADDRVVGPDSSLLILDGWRAAGSEVELHLFQSGGHGFGMTPQGTTSDHWIDSYIWWLQARGLALRPSTLP